MENCLQILRDILKSDIRLAKLPQSAEASHYAAAPFLLALRDIEDDSR